MARKPTYKGLQKKADGLCRQIVRLIYENTCQKCGKHIEGRGADTAHIVSRKNKLLKWDILNLCLLCTGCHMDLHSQGGMKEWVKEKWPARYTYLFEGSPPNCNLLMPYMTAKEKIEWMQNIIAELEDKCKALKEK